MFTLPHAHFYICSTEFRLSAPFRPSTPDLSALPPKLVCTTKNPLRTVTQVFIPSLPPPPLSPMLSTRTAYYHTLARLLFMEDTPSRFKSFMTPLQQVFTEISARSSNCTNPAQLRQMVPQPVVVGLFRDLRGIATATSTRRTYSLLFDWLVSSNGTLRRAAWVALSTYRVFLSERKTIR